MADSKQTIAASGADSSNTPADTQYIEYARDCERLARLADDPLLREQLWQMAREWMAQAMHELKPPEPSNSETNP